MQETVDISQMISTRLLHYRARGLHIQRQKSSLLHQKTDKWDVRKEHHKKTQEAPKDQISQTSIKDDFSILDCTLLDYFFFRFPPSL